MTGIKIKEYLISKGISQTFLANKIDMSVTVLNSILNGNRKLLAEEYFSICKVLDLSLDTFMNKDDIA